MVTAKEAIRRQEGRTVGGGEEEVDVSYNFR
jgi:hypothetical protein